jgi:uncharacterized protein involved in outer membrane biogenesis
MIKKLLIGLVILALIAGALLYFVGGSLLNSGVKKGVETFGPQVTRTPVTLESVKLSPFSGSGTLKGLNVGNPEGFKSGNIFALGQIDVQVDTSTLMSDKIVINEIIITRPEMSYEKTLTNSNVKQLLKNIEAFTGPADASEPAPESEAAATKQVVIRKLVIEEGTIYVGAMGIGQTVKLPRIEMSDIGEDSNQMTAPEVINLVLTKVLSNIGPAIANAGELGKAAGDAANKAGEAAGDAVNKATDSIKNLFGN